jgi:hypothetical protein
LSLSASEFYKLFMHFPYLFGDLVNDSLEKKWKGITTLIEITKIVFSKKLEIFHIEKLREFIKLHLEILTEEYKVNLIRKHHILTHYPSILLAMGPLYFYSSMRYESKHSFFKQKAIRSKNFKNICKLLSTYHQHRFASLLNKNKNIFDFKTKHGKLRAPTKEQTKNARSYGISLNFNVVKFYVYGYMYRQDLFIIDSSVFKQIDLIIFDENDTVKVLCTNYETSYDTFHSSYKVKKTLEKSIVVLRSLKNKESFEQAISKKDNEIYIVSKSVIHI